MDSQTVSRAVAEADCSLPPLATLLLQRIGVETRR